MTRSYLLSIKKEPFEALVQGRKKYEFRRRFSKIHTNFFAALYVSSPIKAIMGAAKFGPVIKDRIPTLLDLTKTDDWNHPRELTANYFAGCEYGYALPVISIGKFREPITLDYLRSLASWFRPPQSYLSLDNSKYLKIREEAFAHAPPNVLV